MKPGASRPPVRAFMEWRSSRSIWPCLNCIATPCSMRRTFCQMLLRRRAATVNPSSPAMNGQAASEDGSGTAAAGCEVPKLAARIARGRRGGFQQTPDPNWIGRHQSANRSPLHPTTAAPNFQQRKAAWQRRAYIRDSPKDFCPSRDRSPPGDRSWRRGFQAVCPSRY